MRWPVRPSSPRGFSHLFCIPRPMLIDSMETSNRRWSAASYRIFSASLTAAEISRRLALRATRSHEVGDPVSSTPGSTRPEAGCLVAGQPSRRSGTHGLTPCCPPRTVGTRGRDPPESGVRMPHGFLLRVRARARARGFTLSPELLDRLARIPGGGFELDLYPPQSLDR